MSGCISVLALNLDLDHLIDEKRTNHDLLALLLTPHTPNRLRWRSDKFDPSLLHTSGKDGRLGQEAVAWVNRLFISCSLCATAGVTIRRRRYLCAGLLSDG